MTNEFDIRQIVYTLIRSLRDSNKEEYLQKRDRSFEFGKYNAVSSSVDRMHFEIKEKNLLQLQENFEQWLSEQKGE